MTIDISTSRALRGPAMLRQLVESVVAAGDHDEADWIEWKGRLDLSSKAGCFHVARAVLGLANRDPERAAVTCEGLGYVIVGAEPHALNGLSTVDPATFDQTIEPYLGGADGPIWSPSYVAIGRATVLVVVVESPRPGDRIHVLRREFDKYIDGTIFVRKHGRTVVARATDLDALHRRVIAQASVDGTTLDLSLRGDVPISWLDTTGIRSDISEWVETKRRSLIEAALTVHRRREEASRSPGAVVTRDGLAAALASLAAQQARAADLLRAAATVEDGRTLDEYEEEVSSWASRLSESALSGFASRFVHGGHGIITLNVENRGSRFLADVEIKVLFEGDVVKGGHERPKWVAYPREPHPFGKARVRDDYSGLLRPPALPLPTTPALSDGAFRRTWVEDGSVKVRWAVGDLRQHGTARSDEIYLFISDRPDDGVLHGTWQATVRDVDGVLSGTIDLPVAEEPTDVRSVLEIVKRGT